MSFAQLTLDGAHPDEVASREILTASPTSETNHDAAIAPWLDEPPTPPPKSPGRIYSFSHKPSFVSFVMPRQPSTHNLVAARKSRPSESHSIAESTASSTSGDTAQITPPTDLRKSKSSLSIFTTILKKSRSRGRLRSETEHAPHFSQSQSFSPPPEALALSLTTPSSPIPVFKGRGKRKPPSSVPPVPPVEPAIRLDTDLGKMDGIVDPTAHPTLPDSISSFGSVMGLNLTDATSSYDFGVDPVLASPRTSMFSNPNPFQPSLISRGSHDRPSGILDRRKISPKTIPPTATPSSPEHASKSLDPQLPTWTAPESWAVDKDGTHADEPEYSSSEDSVTSSTRPNSSSAQVQKRKTRRKIAGRPSRPSISGSHAYSVRIYRANNSYHVASIPLSLTVADLTPVLNRKVLMGEEREVHRLYLKERGRERVLAQTEKPAAIVRRRLEQAGYEAADGLERMGGDDLTFLLKFVYKSQLLGPADDDLRFESFEYIDLTGRSLRAIPPAIHEHADTLHTLTLSRNPMLEIPLDFIQAATRLRKLRLSHMAMKKVPQSVRHSGTLQNLDISCNRIVDLDEAGLDRIPKLMSLKAQNNRMEKLPWYFPRLRYLRILNISNNKFKQLPAVVSVMTSLMELDISFNMISELPEEIGQLTMLEKFIIVGNQVSKIPDECANLSNLKVLDCRRNLISDLSVVCMLPRLEALRADHNAVHALDLSLGPFLNILDASHNEITQLTLQPSQAGCNPYALRSLDISRAKLSSLDGLALSQLSSLESLKLDHNSIRFIPESLGDLALLMLLSCCDNELVALPASIGRLQKLETLDAHNNSLTELPATLWNCASLTHINVTSNLLHVWHDPPSASTTGLTPNPPHKEGFRERKGSTGTTGVGRNLPPLAYSLERLYLGENQFTDEELLPLMILEELTVLNLSFNDIQDLPPWFFRNMTKLEELYLSGNKLTSVPTEDLPRLDRLSVLFLNGNRLQTLPQELGRLQNLTVLDVGSNILKYNIYNWEFDWNWNFNPNLRYLNLSGNKRLEIKADTTPHRSHSARESISHRVTAGFSALTQLRVLGLMDITTTFAENVPEDNESRRVRTSSSTVNGMAYGIADNVGKHELLHMLDVVQPEFRDHRNEAIFAMFGRSQAASNNHLSRYLHDHFVPEFSKELNHHPETIRGEGIPDALRRTFLRLNKMLHNELYAQTSNRKNSQGSDGPVYASTEQATRQQADLRSGASGIVLYLVDKVIYVANAGDALAVISRRGSAVAVSRKHDPFDRQETARIRAAEGWVSPKGCVNDEVDVSRSFGFYHLLPVVNARPDVCRWELSDLDEFVIIGNRGLWDYVDYQTAVDIARSERADPMIAAQKLRDFAISYGAEGSTMIMVICVGDLFNPLVRNPITDAVDVRRVKKKDGIPIRGIGRLDGEVSPPTGHLALVFTDIRNSTHLWEVNAGMPTAIRLHNNLLRRQLRFCGGYEVKTEGDAFMCSFPTALSALWWAMTVQLELLKEPWPLEILECEDGKEIFDAEGNLIARGISVRMGIHCGSPLCEPDPITNRMDYFGPMVNRSARINGKAAGGQIMLSAAIVREINAKVTETMPETEYSEFQPLQAVNAIKEMGVSLVPVGEVKLKGLEVPETMSALYPKSLAGRQYLEQLEAASNASGSRVQFSGEQMRELALLCVRLETLSSSRIFRPLPKPRSLPKDAGPATPSRMDDDIEEAESESIYLYGDPNVLLPVLNETASDADLMMLLESLAIRIENALFSLCLKGVTKSEGNTGQAVIDALKKRGALDERTLAQLLAILES